MNYKNRIIGLEYVDAAELTPHPGNWRKHGKAQVDALRGVLSEVGIADALLAYRSERDGGKLTVIDGHLRKDAAPQTWPVLVLDVSDAEADYILATHDPLAAMADADTAALDSLLTTVSSDDGAVRQMLAELAAEAGIRNESQGEDPGPQEDKAEELRQKWQTAPGQMWLLDSGKGHPHRLICGDCTDRAVVERVMGGEKAEMVWTDPPYGVSVGDKNRYYKSIGLGNRTEDLENDNLSEPDLSAMLCVAFDNAVLQCSVGAAWYVAAPPGPLHILFGQVLKDRGIWRQTIQWVKNNATFSPMGVCYHWQAEPIFFGWIPNGGHRWHGGRKQTTVWEIDRPVASPEHPTMKPVELVVRAVENSSLVGEIVYDPFLGSGTTLIACEKLGRRCRAVEIDPGYTAVALQRFFDMTGVSPVLLEAEP